MSHLDRDTEPLGDLALGGAVLQQQRGMGMPRVVEADADDGRAPDGSALEALGDGVDIERRAVRMTEREIEISS